GCRSLGATGVSRLAEWAWLLEDLFRAAEETAPELSREELDPDRLAELMARREETFRALQEAYEGGRRTEATSQATPASPASSVSSASPASPASPTSPVSLASPGSRVPRTTATSPASSNPTGIAADPKL